MNTYKMTCVLIIHTCSLMPPLQAVVPQKSSNARRSNFYCTMIIIFPFNFVKKSTSLQHTPYRQLNSNCDSRNHTLLLVNEALCLSFKSQSNIGQPILNIQIYMGLISRKVAVGFSVNPGLKSSIISLSLAIDSRNIYGRRI